MRRIKLNKKLDWRLEQLKMQQQKISEKLKDVKKIVELRNNNRQSLRDIGKKLGMSHQKVADLLKQFGIND